jgi:RNA polymerase sigma-32 factor
VTVSKGGKRPRARKTAPEQSSTAPEASDPSSEPVDPEHDEGEQDDEPAAVDDVLEATAEVLADEAIDADAEPALDSESDSDSESDPQPDSRRVRGVDGSSLARADPLQVYMREVQRHALLSPDEEHALAVHYNKTQDVTAAARMVTANLRLVVKIAYEYRRAYRNMMDLVQEGNIGLMQAVKRYDPYRGVKLSSYAAWWIRAYMLRFILNNWRMVKIGTTQAQRKLFFNLSKEKAKLTAMGIEPSHAEIAKRLDVAESEVTEMDRRLSRSDASLDAPVTEGEERTTTRLELLPSLGDSPDQLAEDAQLHQLLREKLEVFRRTLSGKDIAIFDKRLVADEPLTLQELGDEFGVSRERVRQLEARLTGKLRTYLQQELGDGATSS